MKTSSKVGNVFSCKLFVKYDTYFVCVIYFLYIFHDIEAFLIYIIDIKRDLEAERWCVNDLHQLQQKLAAVKQEKLDIAQAGTLRDIQIQRLQHQLHAIKLEKTEFIPKVNISLKDRLNAVKLEKYEKELELRERKV